MKNKTQTQAVKLISITILVVLLIALPLVSALDKSLGLSPTQITALESKGIKTIEVIDYPCDKEHKCFAVDGDIKEKLIEVPLKVRDNCIQKAEIIQKVVNGRLMNITKRTCTGVYNYRDITQIEIDYLIEKKLNKKLVDKIPEVKEDLYYPVKENTTIKSQPIEIGKSTGTWVNKIIKFVQDIIK